MMTSARARLLFTLWFAASLPGFLGAQLSIIRKDAKESSSKRSIEVSGDGGVANLPRLEDAPEMTIAFKTTNGKYASARKNGKMELSTSFRNWEKFKLIKHKGRKVSLRSYHGKYVVGERNGALNADRTRIGSEEIFELIKNQDATVSLKSVRFGKYVVAQSNGQLDANSESIGSQEKFQLIYVDILAMNVDFGGTHHRDSDFSNPSNAQSNGLHEIWRPEGVKSERCGDAACHMCSHKDDCWHGGSQGDMVLAVQGGSLFNSFAQEVFFNCASVDGGHGNMRVRVINNGKINVYVNNKLVHEITGPVHKSQPVDFPFMFDSGSARVRAVFVPLDKNSPSGAEAKIEVLAMPKSVEQCVTFKNCLALLGDGSDEGFELRNNNMFQRTCLESGASSLPSHLQTKCSVWDGCLPLDSKLNLKAILAASGVGLASFADEVSIVSHNSTISNDPNACTMPDVADPESWDCECIEEMIDVCGGTDESCFKDLLCNRAEVCQSWKDEQQCVALIQANKDVGVGRAGDLRAALGQRGRELASSGLGNALDSSLQGKCAI